jgi:hypothetical protein
VAGRIACAICDRLNELPIEFEILVPLMNAYLPYSLVSLDQQRSGGLKLEYPVRKVLSDNVCLFSMTEETRERDYPPIKEMSTEAWMKSHMEAGSAEDGESKNPYCDIVGPPVEVSYVAIRTYGNGDFTVSSPYVRNALRTLKIVIAALYACETLQTKVWEYPWPDEPSPYESNCPPDMMECFYCYTKGGKAKPRYLRLPPLEWEFISSLQLNYSTREQGPNSSAPEPSDFETRRIAKAKLQEDRQAEPDWLVQLRELQKTMAQGLDVDVAPAQRLLTDQTNLSVDQGKDFERVRTALEWFFEGLVSTNTNQTFSFIQFTTAFETLLRVDPKHKEKKKGKEEEETGGITNRLANACADLIANDSDERMEVIKTFKRFYDVRSRIVHGEKADLEEEDKPHYDKLKRYLMDALVQEMRNLPA